MRSSTARAVFERFEEVYARPRSRAAWKVERAVFGAAIGATGYTTRDHANRLIAALGLGPDDHLLELGSGRGWPGVWLASRSGCRLVQTDPQASALTTAESSARRAGIAERCAAVAVDGRALPFPTGTFDAVSHADVLC